MDPAVVFSAFVLIFPVELPDKTFVATLVLSTRYRPLPVWIGVSAAFFVQCLVAVVAGGLLRLLPEPVVLAVLSALLFGLGAVVLWRGARGADAAEAEQEKEFGERDMADVTGWRAAATSFGVLFLAEWGDLSQLLTAGLAARTGDPVSVFTGAWLALITVAGLAAVLGRALLKRVRLATISRVGAGICALLATIALIELTTQLLP